MNQSRCVLVPLCISAEPKVQKHHEEIDFKNKPANDIHMPETIKKIIALLLKRQERIFNAGFRFFSCVDAHAKALKCNPETDRVKLILQLGFR